MLNEQRVKHMVKLAFYETKGGSEEIHISSYRKKDYINYNMWCSIIWMSLAYIAVMVILGLTFLTPVAELLTTQLVTAFVIVVVLLYLLLLITYIVISRKIYRKKHARAYHRVKKFKKDLEELERMYEKEDTNGEII